MPFPTSHVVVAIVSHFKWLRAPTRQLLLEVCKPGLDWITGLDYWTDL